MNIFQSFCYSASSTDERAAQVQYKSTNCKKYSQHMHEYSVADLGVMHGGGGEGASLLPSPSPSPSYSPQK